MDLQNKTIFDFTNDEKIIAKIVGDTPKDYYLQHGHPLNKLADIEDFAAMTNNSELREAAAKEWKKAQAEWDDMVDEDGQDGIIID